MILLLLCVADETDNRARYDMFFFFFPTKTNDYVQHLRRLHNSDTQSTPRSTNKQKNTAKYADYKNLKEKINSFSYTVRSYNTYHKKKKAQLFAKNKTKHDDDDDASGSADNTAADDTTQTPYLSGGNKKQEPLMHGVPTNAATTN